jgi:hypothetical protein
MLRLPYLFTIFLMGAFGLHAQNQSFVGYIEAGDMATDKEDHYNAYRLYAIASEDDWAEDRGYEERISEVFYKAGLAAYKSTAYTEAEKYFLRLLSRPDANAYHLTKFYMAKSTFRQGRYDQAVATFEEFLAEQPDVQEEFREKASRQINEADWAIDAMSREDDIQLRHLPDGINTTDSDVMYVKGPKGTRYFSSNDFEFTKDTLTPKRMLSRIMLQTGENTAKPLGKHINLPGKNVAHTTFSADMTKVYYSVCEFRDYDQMRCDIFMAKIGGDGEWSDPVKLGVNLVGATTTQPNVGANNADGKEYLFFASDRPGGKGGLDIYKVSLDAAGLTMDNATNLDAINTSENDAAPYWYNTWQTLYFTTDGRFSFGGLDIYKAYMIDGEFRTPINLGTPVNSSADDAYYTRFDDPEVAYISSRRPIEEALFYSEKRDVCCYDLYEFAPDNRITLQALTFNKLSAEELKGVTVTLYKITPDGPVVVDEVTNPEANDFNFQVDPGEKYQLKAVKDGYAMAMNEFDLSKPEFKDVPFVERRLDLIPKVDLDVFAFNNVDRTNLVGTKVSLYELTDSGERILVEEITNPDANDSHFELEIGKRYVIVGEKPGFGEASDEIDLRDYDKDGSDTVRKDLYLGQMLDVYVIDAKTELPILAATVSLRSDDGFLDEKDTNNEGNEFHYVVNLDRPFEIDVTRDGYFPRSVTVEFSQADVEKFDGRLSVTIPLNSNNINDFLDLRVYFDNDHPDPDAYSSTTKLAYDDTYGPYLERMDEFKESTAKGLGIEAGFLASGEVEEFFEEQVIPGHEDLLKLADALVQHMAEGRSYELQLVGFASPRAPDSYNLRLSARRNVCLRNFFERYQDGVLSEYIKNGQLSFEAIRKGEEKDLGRIYELIEEERESIYSVEASLERRVEFPKIFNTNSRK